jgi:hypothetical protein
MTETLQNITKSHKKINQPICAKYISNNNNNNFYKKKQLKEEIPLNNKGDEIQSYHSERIVEHKRYSSTSKI